MVKEKTNNPEGKKKLSKKSVIIIAAVLTVVVGLSVFLGVFFGLRNNSANKYEKATTLWTQAKEKTSTDTVTVYFSVGEVTAKLPLRLELTGSRKMTASGEVYSYDAVFYLSEINTPVAAAKFKGDFGTESVKLSMTRTGGVYTFEDASKTLSTSEFSAYDLSRFSFYNTEKIKLEGRKSFSIEAVDAFGFVGSSIAPILDSLTDTEYLTSLWTDHISTGTVRGELAYDKSGRFSSVSSVQSMYLAMTWAEFDEIFEDIELSDDFREIVDSKEIETSLTTVKLRDYCPNNLTVNIRIEASTVFSY